MASISPKRLEGKVALVTGASVGIGESIARMFCKHGAKVVIADIQDDLGKKLSKELGQESAHFVHCDVSNETDVENAVDKTVSLFGKLDIMVNNAGIVGSAINIVNTKKSEFEHVVSTNLVGSFLGTKHAARVMIPNKSGVIVTIGSVGTKVGGAATYAYTSTKHALVGLTKNAAVELGEHGIRVNMVSPFCVTTPLLRNFMNMDDEGCRQVLAGMKIACLSPDDVAESVLFVSSDEAKFMQGHNLMIEGGYTIANRAFNVFGPSA